MVDDNLELEEDSFKFLVETLQKISSNCRQQYLLSGLVKRHKGFPISSYAQGSEGWGKVDEMGKYGQNVRALSGKLRSSLPCLTLWSNKITRP